MDNKHGNTLWIFVEYTLRSKYEGLTIAPLSSQRQDLTGTYISTIEINKNWNLKWTYLKELYFK